MAMIHWQNKQQGDLCGGIYGAVCGFMRESIGGLWAQSEGNPGSCINIEHEEIYGNITVLTIHSKMPNVTQLKYHDRAYSDVCRFMLELIGVFESVRGSASSCISIEGHLFVIAAL